MRYSTWQNCKVNKEDCMEQLKAGNALKKTATKSLKDNTIFIVEKNKHMLENLF